MICPLEWGLGHAARMIPVARILMDLNHNVFIASGKEHLNLFRAELPGLKYIEFPGFKPGYSRHLPQYIPLLLKTPLLVFHIFREHFRLKKLIKEHSIDLVISDNRFGLWNRKIRTAYITHMPLIPFPKPFRFLEFIGIRFHRFFIKRYSLCLIPDLPGEINLTGRLSHGLKLPGNIRYIGILSRFPLKSRPDNGIVMDNKHNAVILSGPEPQKSIFRQLVMEHLKNDNLITVILEGRPGEKQQEAGSGNFVFFSHLDSRNMQDMVTSAEKVITRAGYSTIMELISLGCNAILVPTPGQTEQEYLADYLSSKGLFSSCSQEKLKDCHSLKPGAPEWPDELIEQGAILLHEALGELLE